MKYFVVNFKIQTSADFMQDARDVLSAMAGEAGFETFEDTDGGLKGYIQQSLFDQTLLEEQLSMFPFGKQTVSYSVAEAENRDWNEQWELEGFEPIVVDCHSSSEINHLHRVVIHDGRHLPELSSATTSQTSLLTIEIDAHLAFGTGTHETTRMMIAQLFSLSLQSKLVLDCGCGTGILGIAALKGGATSCTGYDIDEWSSENARHNAIINHVDDRFTSLLGDATVLETIEEKFDIVMANINRNILLADMPAFCSKMKAGGTLLLSGFYLNDVDLLSKKAVSLGLTLKNQTSEGEWACLQFKA